MAVRITDLTTASAIEADDYVVIDGATEGTRKVLATDVGGGSMIDFESSLTPTIDNRGTSVYALTITCADPSNLTTENLIKLSAYLISGGAIYPLIIAQLYHVSGNYYFTAQVKSIQGNVQNTSSTTITGTLHVVAPFEISSVTAGM